MSKVYVPYGLAATCGPGCRAEIIPGKGGFGGPPDVYPLPENYSSPLAELPDWFTYEPQVEITRDGIQLGNKAQLQGTPTAESAQNVTMKIDEPGVNGFVVTDDCEYTIRDSVIELHGDGVDDFAGYSAGVKAANCSTVVLENTKITTSGVIRPCTSATEYSTMIVRNCEFNTLGGHLDRSQPARPGAGKAMKEPPPGLGIGGNCRTHLSVGDSHTYFYDSKIYAEGWAGLSTDACYGDLYLEANRCEVEIRGLGYASYCDNGGNVVLNDSRLKATVGVIVAGQCREYLNRCDLEADHYGALIHSVHGNTHQLAELSVIGGRIHAGRECMLIKSHNVYLDIRGAELASDMGTLIHTMENDDAHATELPDYEPVYGVKVALSDMTVHGDIIHEDVKRTFSLTMKHVKMQGRIENAVLVMDPATTWTATGDSHVTVTATGPVGNIDALEGVTVYVKGDVYAPGTVLELPSGGKLISVDIPPRKLELSF